MSDLNIFNKAIYEKPSKELFEIKDFYYVPV